MFSLSLTLLYLTMGIAYAHPVVVHPTPHNHVTDKTFVITKQDTLNATSTHAPGIHRPVNGPESSTLGFAFVNNYPGSVNGYVTGLDDNGALVFVLGDGSLYYPPNPPAGQPPQELPDSTVAIPLGAQGSTTTVNLASYISAGRIWFAVGSLYFYVNNGANGPALVEPSAVNPDDPNAGTNWGFGELTWNSAQLYADISYVDFVGLPIGMSLTTQADGSQSALGLPANAASTVCSALQAQASQDGAPWDQLCVTDSDGNVLRVLAPNNILSGVDNAFANYWTDYVNQVYSYYTSNTLTITSQNGYGNLEGQVDTSTGDLVFSPGGSFAPPGPGDIFGCNSGPFTNAGDAATLSIVARLCAAFNRATLLNSGGNVQPDGITDYSQYYSTSPTNHYSRIVHQTELDGKGYAFAYDDVTPDGGANISGDVNDPNPVTLTVTVGGPSS